MALATRASGTAQVQFKEVGNSGIFIAQAEANQKNSMRLLKQNGFRALTYREALVKIDLNPELKKQLNGNRFYLKGKGPAQPGYYTFNEKGEFAQGKGDMEKTVYVYPGPQPLMLIVHVGEVARVAGGRFALRVGNPSGIAWAVAGIRAGHEVATPRIEVAQTEEGVQLTGVTREGLMTLQRDSAQELSKVAEAFGSGSLPNTRMLVEALRVKE